MFRLTTHFRCVYLICLSTDAGVGNSTQSIQTRLIKNVNERLTINLAKLSIIDPLSLIFIMKYQG